MHSKTALIITLLPLLGVEAKSYRGSKSSRSTSTQNSLLGASMLQSTSSSTQQFGDTSPGTECSNGGNTNNAGNAAGCNDCGISSFTELTLNENPLVSDCQTMIDNIAADQEWTVTYEKRTLVTFGSCAFNAVASKGGSANIGNADIIDLVTDSISQFKRGEYVGCEGGYDQTVSSSGTMPCDNAAVPGATQVRIDWTLTTSGTVSGGGSGSGSGSGTWFPGTGGQGGVSQGGNNGDDNDWDWINTNQGQGRKQNNQENDPNNWWNVNNVNQKQGQSSQDQDQSFDWSNLQTTNNDNNGNPPQIQRRDGKIYKVVKW